ncbi:arsenate reductase ArsC [Pseudooceanicola sp.]|uniref:arsenate reductase ArsC n=1 Tax=Pseudooceanicola sp. TaxID=1914328 RepID=UPI00261C3ECA|nr:arsenate reductase ArsC [Pseudooceanicola sp.]MDF1857091.1 arsenate reductase ArsC [Pseudooceanicola sp.]
MNILVLCTGNSARSILLEAILNHLGEGRVRAFSAGSKPAGAVHPQSLKLLDAQGYDQASARSKSWDEFAAADAPRMDMVITVCGSAAGETCPVWPGAPLRAHWGVEDPAALPEADWDAGFANVFGLLERRARALLDLRLDGMPADELKSQLDRIGTIA